MPTETSDLDTLRAMLSRAGIMHAVVVRPPGPSIVVDFDGELVQGRKGSGVTFTFTPAGRLSYVDIQGS